jgi:mannose-6-phosphate isomerase-like protein (cupin superfamily)
MNINVSIDSAPKRETIGGSGASKFSMRGMPLLSEGASFDALATAENLWLAVKVYSSGGENALHIHTVEDHAFVVLQGRGTFYFGDGSTSEVIQYEGVMIPKGIAYRFEADEKENLVLLRIGAAQRKTQGIADLQKHGTPAELKGTTFDADGSEKDGRNPKTGTPSKPIIPIPGRFFPER